MVVPCLSPLSDTALQLVSHFAVGLLAFTDYGARGGERQVPDVQEAVSPFPPVSPFQLVG